jgi:hypothetical protein
MIVDLASLWEPGQAYVALSRVRSTEGLFIERWTPSSIKAEPLVTAFYDDMAQRMHTFAQRPLYTPHIAPAKPRTKEPESDGIKEKRGQMIREMIAKQLSLQHMSEEVGIKQDRVLLYIEDFLAQSIPLELDYLVSDIPEASRIRDVFEEHGTALLKPAFQALDEVIPYTTLRLVRCAIMAGSGA